MRSLALVSIALSLLLSQSACRKSPEQFAAELAKLEQKRAAEKDAADAKAAADTAAAERAAAEAEARGKAIANEAVKKRLISALEAKMKDAGSAQYRGVIAKARAVQHSDGRYMDVICGQVNSKNSFGGYTGFKTFYIWQMEGDTPSIWSEEQGEPSASIAERGARAMGCLT